MIYPVAMDDASFCYYKWRAKKTQNPQNHSDDLKGFWKKLKWNCPPNWMIFMRLFGLQMFGSTPNEESWLMAWRTFLCFRGMTISFNRWLEVQVFSYVLCLRSENHSLEWGWSKDGELVEKMVWSLEKILKVLSQTHFSKSVLSWYYARLKGKKSSSPLGDVHLHPHFLALSS